MSQEEVKRLIERMNADEAFREKVLAAPDVAARLELAAAEGYVVTEEDLAGAEGALTDAELGRVAGGSEMQGVDDGGSHGEYMPSCCCYS